MYTAIQFSASMYTSCNASLQQDMWREDGQVPVSVFGRTHTASTGTCSMARFPGVVFQIEPLVLPMVRFPLPPQYCHPAVQPDFHNLRLMRAITGWFALDRWVVTCVNME